MTRHAVACGAMLLGLGSAFAQLAVGTLAGNPGSIQIGSADGTGSAATFSSPAGVAVDAAGNVYVADVNNHKIRKITPAGVVTTLAGAGSPGSVNGTGTGAAFNFPQGVATDGTNVYVGDQANHVIRQIVISTGVVTTLAGTAGTSGTVDGTGAAARFNLPAGLVVVGTDLYVADAGNHAIRKIVISTGVVTTIAGTIGVSGSTDATGILASFKNPNGITAESTNNLYVSDTGNNTIRKIVIATGVVSTFAGTAGTGGNIDASGASAAFKNPAGIAVSGVNLYVADTINNSLRQIVITTQAVTTIAGSTSGGAGGLDAIGTNARFNGPSGLGVNTSGIIYIADTANQRIRAAGPATSATVSNPAAVAVALGAPATFTVTTGGNPTPTIVWERQAAGTVGFVALTNVAPYSGVFTTTLTVSPTTSVMSGDQFRATVTNGAPSTATSNAAALTVQLAPTITSAASTTVALNNPINFTFLASGSPAPTFTVVAGSFPPFASLAPTGALTGTPTAANSGGSPYTFTISAGNGVGSPSTQSFTLSVQNGAAIASQPANAVVSPGGTANFSVTASGTPATFTYQWYRSAGGVSGFFPITDIPGTYFGSNTATLTVQNATQGMNADQFQVVVSNGIGSVVTSNPVTLTVAVAPQITSLNSTIFAINQFNAFQIQASGAPAPSFSIVAGTQPTTWALSLNPTSGLLSGTPTSDAGSPFIFVIRASNGVNVSDQTFSLSVTPQGAFPAITTQPVSVTASIGQPAAFTVVVTGSPLPTLQWQRQSSAGEGFTNIVDGGPYSGATTATLNIANVTTGMNNDQYQVVASSTVNGVPATATSNIATLTVNVGTIITTIAGTAGISGTVDGVGLAAQFANPYSIAVDLAGNMYVADPFANVIRKITAAGVVTTFAGTAGSAGSVDGVGSAARFNGPYGVAVDGSGNIYVADTNNHTIRGISQSGNVITLAGTAGAFGSVDGVGNAARFNYPFGLVIDNQGAIYVSDTYNHMIRRIATNGTVSTVAGAAGLRGTTDAFGTSARFAYPTGIAVDTQQNLYIADSNNGSIRKISQANSNQVTTYAGTSGSFGTADGNTTLGTPRFNQPNGVAVDSTGTLYVADSFSHTIRRVSTVGDVTTIAGLPGNIGSADGTGSAARFSQPNGIAVDSSGNLYIADTQNRTIRRSGAVTGAVITTQPTNASAAPGSSATFTVVATGSPLPALYRWQRKPADASTDFVNLSDDGISYSGSLTATLTVSNITAAMNNDLFRVVVSNFVNPDAVSNAVTLSTVVAAPVFTSVASTSFRATELGAFTVTASGNPAPTFSGSGLPSWLTINSAGVLSGTAPDTAGSPFTLTLTANNGVAVNQTFTLTVTPAVVAPAIITQPVGGALNRGSTATFTVVASGSNPLTYQWNKDGLPLNGATTSTLVLAGIQPINAGAYTVTVNNPANVPVTSAAAPLTVNAPPVIVSQPQSQTVLAGGAATFSVVATGTPAPLYQWRANGQIIPNATSSTLIISNAQAVNAANYDVLVNNGIGGSLSSLAQLTVVTAATAPVITSSPAPRTAVVGSSTILSVGVSAAHAPSYQWRKGGVSITGATGPTLSLGNLQLGDSANYDVIVTNSVGSATSSSAAVTVVRRSYAGAYFGTFGSGLGNFAFFVRPDNTGLFLGYLPGSSTGIRNSDLTVSDTGVINFFQGTVNVSGVISDTGTVTGAVIGTANTSFAGAKSVDSGSTAGLTGIYQAGALNTSATAYAVVGSAGQAFVLVQTTSTIDGGQGTLDGNNRVTISTARQSITATITPDTSVLSVVVAGATTTTFSGAGEATLATQRLANISSRATVGSGNAVTIAGFVISGQDSKPVLIRAIGPTLGALGVATALAQPKLELFRANGTLITSNTGWTTGGNTEGIIAATIRAGAFPLAQTAADSVILATLPPGAYTAVISSANASPGVALAEVYDLSAAAAGQKLFNISTRASTGVGDSILTAGVVVSGTVPKRVLIRGVGPTLASLGVTGALAQPQLTVIKDGTPATTVATNSNWKSSSDEAAAIASASTQVGAFALGANNADAAMIVSLAPGNYSVQLTGVGGTAGIAIIEVYELP